MLIKINFPLLVNKILHKKNKKCFVSEFVSSEKINI